MMQKLRQFAHNMTGFGGCMLACFLFAAGVLVNDSYPNMLAGLNYGIGMSSIFAVVLVGTAWQVFPRMRAEMDEQRFQGWYVLLTLSLIVISAPVTAVWKDLDWLVGKISFGVLGIPEIVPMLVSRYAWWLGRLGMILALASTVWAWRFDDGFDRHVLVLISVTHSAWLANMLFPESIGVVWLVIAYVLFVLGSGKRIGRATRIFIENILSYYRRPRAEPGPTSIEMPAKGTDISKL